MASEKKTRRGFLSSVGLAAAGLAAGAAFVNATRAKAVPVFRPPGAGSEERFLARCIRCGRCALKCPYDCIKMSPQSAGIAAGTPHIDFRDTPCYLCDGFPCVQACPTGALSKSVLRMEDVYMGTAQIVDTDECLSIKGLRCEICHRECPLIDRAITVEISLNRQTGVHTIFRPVVHKDQCVGCGICEHVCPLDAPAIKVLLGMRGDSSAHYVEQDEELEETAP